MSKHRLIVAPVMFMLRLGAAATVTLCLVQCSAEQGVDDSSEPALGSVSQALEQCGGARVFGDLGLQGQRSSLWGTEYGSLPRRFPARVRLEARHVKRQLPLHRARRSAVHSVWRNTRGPALHQDFRFLC
jgi:hypothetical protein